MAPSLGWLGPPCTSFGVVIDQRAEDVDDKAVVNIILHQPLQSLQARDLKLCWVCNKNVPSLPLLRFAVRWVYSLCKDVVPCTSVDRRPCYASGMLKAPQQNGSVADISKTGHPKR